MLIQISESFVFDLSLSLDLYLGLLALSDDLLYVASNLRVESELGQRPLLQHLDEFVEVSDELVPLPDLTATEDVRPNRIGTSELQQSEPENSLGSPNSGIVLVADLSEVATLEKVFAFFRVERCLSKQNDQNLFGGDPTRLKDIPHL